MDWQKIVTFAGILGAGVTIIGFAWAFGDNTGYRPFLKKEMTEFTAHDFKLVMDQTQQNTLAITKNEFDLLWGQRTHGNSLVFDDKVKLCKDAQILDYTVTDEQNLPICSKDGTPMFTFPSQAK